GAEVYIDSDGFRLVSGSILQLVPNNLESGRSIRGNMDVLMGNPVISINGGSDNELSDSAEYIQFEISGNNSKFTRIVLAESVGVPIYQQLADELMPCKKFLIVDETAFYTREISAGNCNDNYRYEVKMNAIPAVTVVSASGVGVYSMDAALFTEYGFLMYSSTPAAATKITADARP
ncbi:MAG: hypothetical protein GW890_12490, partial [Vibrio sp.]|nr:hypothetical protein [Vibrio sp.]